MTSCDISYNTRSTIVAPWNVTSFDMLSARNQAFLSSKKLRAVLSSGNYAPGRRKTFATVSPSILAYPEPPPPPPPSSVLDGQLLSALDVSKTHTSLANVVKQYVAYTGNILDVSLPYESRPTETRRPGLTHVNSSTVLIAHCVREGSENKITLSSGFALEAPSPSKDETLILTCAHTLEEVRYR